MFTRRASVAVPDSVDELAIELPSADTEPEAEAVSVSGVASSQISVVTGPVVRVPVSKAGVNDVRLSRIGADDSTPRNESVVEPWALGRRLLVEARDRALPLFRSRGS